MLRSVSALKMTVDTYTINKSGICVGIIGVGFVGESLLREFGSHYKSVGFDISQKRIEELKPRFTHLPNVQLTTNRSVLSSVTHYLVSVPTLLKEDRSVNLTHLKNALQMVSTFARPGCTIVIESSVSVGMTRSLLGPYKDIIHCGMSPERVDPGRILPAAHQIPKIVSGLTPTALSEIENLYSHVFDRVVPVSAPEVAEMAKLFENCYRMVNIAYVNEMSDACLAHGIDPHEMISAAATKPFGFQEFRPGLGVGGHCIPVNPFYLFANNENLPVLQQSTDLMWSRPKKLATEFYNQQVKFGKSKYRSGRKPRILVVGVGFKPGESVLSHSPGLAFAEALRTLGCDKLAFYDPLVLQDQVPWMQKWVDECWNVEDLTASFDAVAVCVEQHGVDLTILDRLQQVEVYSYGKVKLPIASTTKLDSDTGAARQWLTGLQSLTSIPEHVLRPFARVM